MRETDRSPGYRRRHKGQAGFALVEVLAALALTMLLAGLILPIVSSAAAHWSGSVFRGYRLDELMRARISMGKEIAGMEMIQAREATESTTVAPIWFRGSESSILFARRTGDPEALPDLSAVSFTIERDGAEVNLVRRFTTLMGKGMNIDERQLSHPSAVLTGFPAMRFVFLDAFGNSLPAWSNRSDLPTVIELRLSNMAGTSLPLSFYRP